MIAAGCVALCVDRSNEATDVGCPAHDRYIQIHGLVCIVIVNVVVNLYL